MKGQRVEGSGDGRAYFQARGSGFEALQIRAGGCRRGARLRLLFSARAFFELAQGCFGLMQARLGGVRGLHLPIGIRLAHQAARHQPEQAVALAYRVVAFRARAIAARRGGADAGRARAVLELSNPRFGLGELRARGVEFRAGNRAVLDDHDITGFDRRAFGEWQRHDEFVGVGSEFHAIALDCARQLAFVMARAGAERGGG